MLSALSIKHLNKMLLATTAVLIMSGCAGTQPKNLGITADGKLQACPSSPNCVSSFADKTDKEHYIAPYDIKGDDLAAWKSLKRSVQATEDAKMINSTHNYVYAQYTSSLFHFVDDVEFMLDTSGNKIQLRSASRIGYSDLGVNRKRLEDLEAKLKKEGVLK
jgi:uncharacterized protein (DUF1499 family)